MVPEAVTDFTVSNGAVLAAGVVASELGRGGRAGGAVGAVGAVLVNVFLLRRAGVGGTEGSATLPNMTVSRCGWRLERRLEGLETRG